MKTDLLDGTLTLEQWLDKEVGFDLVLYCRVISNCRAFRLSETTKIGLKLGILNLQVAEIAPHLYPANAPIH